VDASKRKTPPDTLLIEPEADCSSGYRCMFPMHSRRVLINGPKG
jgi:hypothetical protein